MNKMEVFLFKLFGKDFDKTLPVATFHGDLKANENKQEHPTKQLCLGALAKPKIPSWPCGNAKVKISNTKTVLPV